MLARGALAELPLFPPRARCSRRTRGATRFWTSSSTPRVTPPHGVSCPSLIYKWVREGGSTRASARSTLPLSPFDHDDQPNLTTAPVPARGDAI